MFGEALYSMMNESYQVNLKEFLIKELFNQNYLEASLYKS